MSMAFSKTGEALRQRKLNFVEAILIAKSQLIWEALTRLQ